MNPPVALCRIGDIPDGDAIAAHVPAPEGVDELIVLRQGERAFVYHNECPHQGRHLDYAPGRFLVREGRLICAAHGATFAVDSGECIAGPCRGSRLIAVPVQIVDGDVVLR
jgi:nitrite reductase/ring-hydroxylating ferredoxin subunit